MLLIINNIWNKKEIPFFFNFIFLKHNIFFFFVHFAILTCQTVIGTRILFHRDTWIVRDFLYQHILTEYTVTIIYYNITYRTTSCSSCVSITLLCILCYILLYDISFNATADTTRETWVHNITTIYRLTETWGTIFETTTNMLIYRSSGRGSSSSSNSSDIVVTVKKRFLNSFFRTE